MSKERLALDNAEKSRVSYERCLEEARELYNRYGKKMAEITYEEVDGVSPFKKSLIRHFLSAVPPELQEQYFGHGITRGGNVDMLAALLEILYNHSIRGDYARLAGSGFIDAYKFGSALIVSRRGEDLGRREGGRLKINSDRTFDTDIGAVVLNRVFYPLIDELKKMFPNENIIKASEIAEYMGVA